MNFEMCSFYFRDKVRNLGWEKVGIMSKIYNFIFTLWNEKKRMIQILRGKYKYVRQVELVLTTKCTLRCKECANLMQYYKKSYDVDRLKISLSINRLASLVDEINTVVLIGGEPFLYKEISYIIDEICNLKNINHINIFTNGTIIPCKDAITSLQNKKVLVTISDYGDVSIKKYELEQFCNKNKIKYYMKNKDLHWGYVGDMNSRKRNEKQLNKQFKNCKNYCRSILNGKLYYCPRAAHGDDLGFVNTSYGEYCDLLNGNVAIDDVMKLIYSNHYFSACNYCNYGTKDMISITPGVQMTYNEKRDLYKK